MAALLEALRAPSTTPESGSRSVVFVENVEDADQVASFLLQRGVNTVLFHM